MSSELALVDAGNKKTYGVLVVVLAVASILRLYHLDVPSMWLDEILVPMAAAHPLDYIFDLCRHVEVHPPGYYLLTKVVLLAGKSDFALRIISAVCGIFSVYLVFQWVREMSGEGPGVLAAAFLAVNPLHIYDSRVVRPYSIFLLVMLLGLIWLFRYFRTGSMHSFRLFLVANALLILIHYAALLLAGALGLVLFWSWLRHRNRENLRALSEYGISCLIAFSMILPFFLGRVEKTHQGQFMGFNFVDASINTAHKLIEVIHMFNSWPLRVLMGVLVLSGAFWLVRRGGWKGRAVVVLVLTPLAMLLGTKYDYYAYNVWHLSFLLPGLSCMAGHCLGGYFPRAISGLALAVTLGVGGYMAVGHATDYFAEDSAILPYYVLSKPLARELPLHFRPGDLVAVNDFGVFNGLSWYLDQFVSENVLVKQHLDPNQQQVRLKYLSGLNQFGGLAKNEADFRDKLGAPAAVTGLKQAKIYEFTIERAPGLVLKTLPGQAHLSAKIREFYSTVDTLDNLTFDGNWGGAFSPTLPNKPASVSFHVRNEAGNAAQLITIGLKYVNDGKGNILKVFCRFDDEPEWLAFTSHGPDKSTMDLAIVERKQQYSKLSVRCEMILAAQSARFPGGNQETLGLREAFVHTEAL